MKIVIIGAMSKKRFGLLIAFVKRAVIANKDNPIKRMVKEFMASPLVFQKRSKS